MTEKPSYPKYFLSHRDLFPEPDIFHISTDKNGVALWDYKGRVGLHLEYVPWVVSFYALGMYNLYCDKHEEGYLKKFFEQVDFLVETFFRGENCGMWPVELPWVSAGYVCVPPYAIAMYQGLGISVMMRAWALTEDKLFLDIAKEALSSFSVAASKGGVLKVDEKGFWWYEDACLKSNNILNHFLFALVGIYEYYDVTRDSDALFLLSQGTKTLDYYLNRYELNLVFVKWSRYDDGLLVYSGQKYHSWHVKQLLKLYKATGEKKFFAKAKEWFEYQQRYSFIVDSKFFRFVWRFLYSSPLHKLYELMYNPVGLVDAK